MRELGLHTVCEEARCPNIGECWEHKAATFMILGDVCTRNCAYCAVAHGTPAAFDPLEPVRLAEAVERMGLAHVVITSVDRDDLPNGGAEAFAGCVTEIRRRHARDVGRGAHPRLQGLGAGARDRDGRRVPTSSITISRPQNGSTAWPAPAAGTTGRSHCWPMPAAWIPDALTKSGIILGMGEEWDEVLVCMRDLRRSDVNILTLGQYLRPSDSHLPVARYYTPDEFAELRDLGTGDGVHARPVEPAHPLVVPRLGAGVARRRRGAPLMAGTGDPKARHGPSAGSIRRGPRSTARWLRQMMLIRRFEEKAGEAYSLGKIGGFCHLYIGQEAVAVGSLAALRAGRLHHLLLPRARPRARAGHQRRARSWPSCSARPTGCSGGKGGSMHLFDASLGFLGGHGIVGGHIPLTTGHGVRHQVPRHATRSRSATSARPR